MRELKKIFYLFFFVGFIALGIGGWLYYNTYSFLKRSITINGVVIEIVEASGGGVYKPKVEYTDHKGVKRITYSSGASNPPGYYKGEKVKIFYDPNDPKYPTKAKIDGTFSLYGSAIIISIIGSAFILIPLLAIYISNAAIYKGDMEINIFYKKKDKLAYQEERLKLEHKRLAYQEKQLKKDQISYEKNLIKYQKMKQKYDAKHGKR